MTHTLYRVLSYILLPVVILLAAFDVVALFVALSNPPMLLGVFMVACVAFYVFGSFRFFNNAVVLGKNCKPSLKDWVKVNAIVTLIFALMMLFQVAVILMNPALLQKALDETAAQMQGSTAQPFSKETLLSTAKGFMYFFMILSVILIIHIVITFRYLKQYRNLFSDSTKQP